MKKNTYHELIYEKTDVFRFHLLKISLDLLEESPRLKTLKSLLYIVAVLLFDSL
jgi:VanZ family protein